MELTYRNIASSENELAKNYFKNGREMTAYIFKNNYVLINDRSFIFASSTTDFGKIEDIITFSKPIIIKKYE